MPSTQLAFQEFGNSSQTPVLFLHGFMGSKEDWQGPIQSLLALNPFHCIALDLPGHGESPLANLQSPHSQSPLETVSSLIAKFLQDHQVFPVHVVGYSMGGRVALHLALTYPHLVSSLILESASPGIENPQERLKRKEEDHHLFKGVTADNWMDFLMKWYSQKIFGSLAQDKNFPQLLSQRMKNSPKKMQKALDHFSVGNHPSLWSQIRHYPGRILTLSGSEDEKYNMIGNKMRSYHPSLTHLTIEQSGHAVHFQQTERMALAIGNFILQKN